MTALAAAAELTTIDGSGHLVNLERPGALVDELTRFLADQPAL